MISKELQSMYPSNSRVSNKELKAVLQKMYDKYGIKAKATAVDIAKYGYSVRACKILWFDSFVYSEIRGFQAYLYT